MRVNDLDSSVVLANLLDDEVPEFSGAPQAVKAIIELAKAFEFQIMAQGSVKHWQPKDLHPQVSLLVERVNDKYTYRGVIYALCILFSGVDTIRLRW